MTTFFRTRPQAKKNQGYGNLLAQPPNTPRTQASQVNEEQPQAQSAEGSRCRLWLLKQCPIIRNRFDSRISSDRRPSILADYLSRPSPASVRRLEDITNRATAYVIGYLLCFTFSLIFQIYGSDSAPFPIILLARLSFPLQGFFNVLIYTYPHVVSYRRNRTECNWFKAFWEVIKTGGDSDQSRINRRGNRRQSLRQRQRVLAQSGLRRNNEQV